MAALECAGHQLGVRSVLLVPHASNLHHSHDGASSDIQLRYLVRKPLADLERMLRNSSPLASLGRHRQEQSQNTDCYGDLNTQASNSRRPDREYVQKTLY